jgi:hypothetical protein
LYSSSPALAPAQQARNFDMCGKLKLIEGHKPFQLKSASSKMARIPREARRIARQHNNRGDLRCCE